MERLPLFGRSLVKKFSEERVNAIAGALAGRIEKEHDPGFMTGLAGQSMFLYQYGRTNGSDRHENLGFLALERALAIIDKGFAWPSYAAGLAGIRWTLHYLARKGYIRQSDGAALDDTDPLLANFARERFAAGDYDVLHGALGMYLATDFAPLTSDPGLYEALSTLALPVGPDQVAWPSRNPKTGQEEINIGLAHGIPSILLLLSSLLTSERIKPLSDQIKPPGDHAKAAGLLNQGVNYLLSCRYPKAPNGSIFPHRMLDGQPDQPGRLAWCYGDPGVGAALWHTGANSGRPDWQSEATAILRTAAGRTRAKANRIYDACLCHGTAGLAMIFYKMAQLTGHDELLDAAVRWTNATIDHGHNEAAAGGYLYLTTGNRYVSNYGLLEGITGTGLALLTLMEPENMGWETGMLI